MTKDEWQQVVEEFGDCAFERVTMRYAPHINVQCELQSNQDFLEYDLQDIQLKPIHKLFKHDVAVYGDDAFLMWELFCFEKWMTAQDNQQVRLKLIISHENIRRKTSAALPFDLERAKGGDVVDFKNVIENSYTGLERNEWLRMKYPPKKLVLSSKRLK